MPCSRPVLQHSLAAGKKQTHAGVFCALTPSQTSMRSSSWKGDALLSCGKITPREDMEAGGFCSAGALLLAAAASGDWRVLLWHAVLLQVLTDGCRSDREPVETQAYV